jgi:L-amino acid N-acyltransferase YncA
MESIIRMASAGDAARVAEIYAPYVTERVTSFELEAPDGATMAARMAKTTERFPWLAWVVDGELAGYANASAHSDRAAYRWGVNVGIYLDQAFHRMGGGRKLYEALFEILQLQGLQQAYAGITLPNEGSVGLHQALGFREIGIYRDVGFKFGRWHDVGWYGRTIGASLDPAPAEPIALPALLDREPVRKYRAAA